MTPAAPRWMTLFLDVPDVDFERSVRFWAAALGCKVSPSRGVHEEFVTLRQPDGDAVVRLQKLVDGPARVHLDLHVDDIRAATAAAREAGATLLESDGSVPVLASPAGIVFCFVDPGPSRRPAPVAWGGGGVRVVDQICLDVPADSYDTEVAFWSALTGWEHHRSEEHPEFGWWDRPEGFPVVVVSQRVGDRDARVHLDVGTDDAARAAEHHVELGATEVGDGPFWRVLRDPAGLPYCLADHLNVG
ncbi:MAG: VOC family protein [Nocardioides sp.]|nr:VOC family protein [Nocardioides sp.]